MLMFWCLDPTAIHVTGHNSSVPCFLILMVPDSNLGQNKCFLNWCFPWFFSVPLDKCWHSSSNYEQKTNDVKLLPLYCDLLIVVMFMVLRPHFGPWPLFQFLNPTHSLHDGRLACPKATSYTQHNKNTSMPPVGFEISPQSWGRWRQFTS
jgi:hypothetical protein